MIPDALAIALAPFAPADSAIRAQGEEAARIRADLAYNQMKNSGELRRREDDLALAEQIKWASE